jgi:hypothetical protein
MPGLTRSNAAWRQDALWLAAIGVSGAAVRLAFGWQYTREPLGRYPWVDEASYWTWAQAILRGGWWPVRPFYQDPLYPYWLACLMGVVGSEVARLRIASAGLGAITPLVVAWAGRIGLGRAEGLVAGWATALYGPLIFADGSLEKEGLAAFCTAVALGLTAHLACVGRPLPSALAGASWGVVALLRSNALVVAPVAVVWLALCGSIISRARGCRQGGTGLQSVTESDTGKMPVPPRTERGARDPRSGTGLQPVLEPDTGKMPVPLKTARGTCELASPRGWLLAMGFLAGFLLVVAPVALINTLVSNPHELLGTTWQIGPNFYIGNGPDATGTYMAPPFVRAHPSYEAADYAVEAMRRAGRPLTPGQVSRFWLLEGLRQWGASPLQSIRLLIRKLGLVTHRLEIPDNQDIEFVRIVAAPALGFGLVDFGILFPLATMGLARVPRTAFWWFLSLATGLGLVATTVFFVVGRYRVPWVPGLAILAGAGLVDLVRVIRLGDWRDLVWRAGLVGIPAAFLSWRPLADPAPARWGNQLVALALADLRAGQLEPAIDALDLARASGSQGADRVRELSVDGPFHDLLFAAVQRALGKSDNLADTATVSVRQARMLRQLPERSAQARSILEARLRADPADAAANRELGALLLSWPHAPSDRALALEALQRGSERASRDLRSTLLLALATSRRQLLDRAPPEAGRNDKMLTTLVAAVLASRAGSP